MRGNLGSTGDVRARFTSHSDPAPQSNGKRKCLAFFACSDNSLLETDKTTTIEVEASRTIWQSQAAATCTPMRGSGGRLKHTPQVPSTDQPMGRLKPLTVYFEGDED